MRTLMRDMLQMLYWALIWRMCSNTRRLPKKNGVCGMLFYPPWSWWSVWSTNGWGIPWFLDLWFGDWWVNIPTPVGPCQTLRCWIGQTRYLQRDWRIQTVQEICVRFFYLSPQFCFSNLQLFSVICLSINTLVNIKMEGNCGCSSTR